jgi:hypothetical protein
LVQLSVDSNVFCLHHQSSELSDFTHSSLSFLLECHLVHSVSQLDCAVNTLFRHLFLLLSLHHCNIISILYKIFFITIFKHYIIHYLYKKSSDNINNKII